MKTDPRLTRMPDEVAARLETRLRQAITASKAAKRRAWRKRLVTATVAAAILAAAIIPALRISNPETIPQNPVAKAPHPSASPKAPKATVATVATVAIVAPQTPQTPIAPKAPETAETAEAPRIITDPCEAQALLAAVLCEAEAAIIQSEASIEFMN